MEDLALAAVRYAAEHFSDILSLDDIARRYAVSPATASRWFRQVTGRTFTAYMSGLRLEYAAHELSTTDDDIAMVAKRSGFSSTSVFSRNFRNVYGTPPREYRTTHHVPQDKPLRSRFQVEASARGSLSCLKLEVSIGPIANMGIPSFQSHILSLIDQLDIENVRIENGLTDFLFQHDNAYQYLVREREYEGFEASILDGTFDPFVERDLAVTFELANRPWSIRRSAGDYLVEVAAKPQFTTARKMTDATAALLRHWKRRYGTNRLQDWALDVWFDRNLWTVNEYVELLASVRATTRDILPGCAIGGGGISPVDNAPLLSTLIEALHNHHMPLDYLIIASNRHPLAPSAASTGGDSSRLRDDILTTEHLLHAQGLDVPIKVNDWNPVPSQRNRYNDSSEKGAMLIDELTNCMNLPVTVTYASLTDFNSLYSDVDTCFFGGNGLAGQDGFPKPVLHAFEFCKAMSGDILAQGSDHMLVRGPDRSYSLLLWNRSGLMPRFLQAREYELSLAQLQLYYRQEHTVRHDVILTDMPRNRYLMREYQVNDDSGNGVAACSKLEVDGRLGIDDHRFVAANSLPTLTLRKLAQTDGALRFEVSLPPHGFALCRLTEQ